MMTGYYIVAGCPFAVTGERLAAAVASLPGFAEFAASGRDARSEFVEASDSEAPLEKDLLFELFHDGVFMRFSTCDGGHVLRLTKDGSDEWLWRTSPGTVNISGNLDAQLLKFALWIGYGLETIGLHRIPMHCSCIVSDGRAYLFLGESGTGKSTHTRLWRENIDGAFLLNDDSPVVAFENDEVRVYGSPWSGKTPCYRQESYPLGGCVRLSQAPFNRITRLSILKSYAALHPSCPPQFAKDRLYDSIGVTLGEILKRIPVWHLECLPDADAARLSHDTITQ